MAKPARPSHPAQEMLDIRLAIDRSMTTYNEEQQQKRHSDIYGRQRSVSSETLSPPTNDLHTSSPGPEEQALIDWEDPKMKERERKNREILGLFSPASGSVDTPCSSSSSAGTPLLYPDLRTFVTPPTFSPSTSSHFTPVSATSVDVKTDETQHETQLQSTSPRRTSSVPAFSLYATQSAAADNAVEAATNPSTSRDVRWRSDGIPPMTGIVKESDAVTAPPLPPRLKPPVGGGSHSHVSECEQSLLLAVPFQPSSFRLCNGDLIDLGHNQVIDDVLLFDPLYLKTKQQQQMNVEYVKQDEQAFLTNQRPPKPPRLSLKSPPIVNRSNTTHKQPQTAPITSPRQRTCSESDQQTVLSRDQPNRPSRPLSIGRWLTVADLELTHSIPEIRKQVELLVASLPLTKLSDVWSRLIMAPTVPHPLPANWSSVVTVVADPALGQGDFQTRDNCSLGETTIEHLLMNVLCKMDGDNSSLNADNYVLKIYGLDAYLYPKHKLADYEYVRRCAVSLQDVLLEICHFPPEADNALGDCDAANVSTSVTPSYHGRNTVQTLLDTLQTEMDKLRHSLTADDFSSPGGGKAKGVEQTVKMLCKAFAEVEPSDVVTSLHHLRQAVDSPWRFRDAEHSLTKALHRMLTSCLRSSTADYQLMKFPFDSFSTGAKSPGGTVDLPPEVNATGERQLISSLNIEDRPSLRLEAVYNVDANWCYDTYYVTCHALYGSTELCHSLRFDATPENSRTQRFYPCLMVDAEVTLDLMLCIAPLQTRLCFVLYGVNTTASNTESPGTPMETPSHRRRRLGWATLPLFDSNSRLCQGSMVVALGSLDVIQPWGPLVLLESTEKNPVLLVTLPTFEYDVEFPYLSPQTSGSFTRQSREFSSLEDETRQYLKDVIEGNVGHQLSTDEKEVLWEKRHYLREFPSALPLVLSSAVAWDCASVANIHGLLKEWSELSPVIAIELLLPQYADVEVRAQAVAWLCRAPSDTLLHFLPQLVEALRYETAEHSALALALLSLACESRRFAYHLFWQLEQRKADSSRGYACRCRLLGDLLLSILGLDFKREVQRQKEFIRRLDTIAQRAKNDSDSVRERHLKQEASALDAELLSQHCRLPIHPSFIASGTLPNECGYYNSYTTPIRIKFRSVVGDYAIMNKLGDDLRQDTLVLQMMQLMDQIWLKNGTDFRMIIFRCLPTGPTKGLIELVGDCKTFRELQGATKVFKSGLIHDFIKRNNPSQPDYITALRNFRTSCAGWCVGTYVLGIGDRHNDNLLVTTRGHLFHIDFGKYLGDWQLTVGGMRRDRTPFVLTKDMVDVIRQEGALTSMSEVRASSEQAFQEFVELCCSAFNLIRQNHLLFVNLLKLMVCSGIPCLTVDAVQFIEANLWLDCSDGEATARFTRMIEQTLDNSFVSWNFLFHSLAQLKSGGDDVAENPDALSFVSQTYSSKTDGRLTGVQIVCCEKWKQKQQEKVYMYKMSVSRERETVSMTIYRSYKEFYEFYLKLYRKFPLATLQSLPSREQLGRNNVRDVAERRKNHLVAFLRSLFALHHEISHCDLVYTFFHPILRDQEDPVARMAAQSDRNLTAAVTVGGGEVRMTLEFKRGVLEVLISHARNLPSASAGNLPDSYVKCYLRPDTTRATKRKTKVVKKSQNPTFNEVLIYQLSPGALKTKELEVSVWHSDTLKGNQFLGGAVLQLSSLSSESDTKQTHTVALTTALPARLR